MSNSVIETIVSNYEDGFIDDDEFVQTLLMFDKRPVNPEWKSLIEQINSNLKNNTPYPNPNLLTILQKLPQSILPAKFLMKQERKLILNPMLKADLLQKL